MPPFPEGTAFGIRTIHIRDVATADKLNQPTDGFSVLWREQHVNMVRHQHVGVDRATVSASAFVQPLKVRGAVPIAKEGGLPAIAALDDVGGDIGEVEAGFSWHVTVLVTFAVARECRAITV